MNSNLAFAYRWDLHNIPELRRYVREFLDNGVNRFVIKSDMLEAMIHDLSMIKELSGICSEMKVYFSSVHALFGNGFDLNTVNPERRPEMIKEHIRGMEIAADFGCKTYAIHVGAAHYCYDRIPLETLRPLALDTLEKLLPAAEKLGMVIAVENSFEMPNSAKEVLQIVRHFDGNPAIGVCYDTGHANCMEYVPGKDKSLYQPYFPVCWWEEGVIYENNAIETLKDYIVTCHIHDNDGYGDLHGMPFDGTINWQELMPKLRSCPGMIDFQTEVNMDDGENWAGTLLAPAGGYSIRKLVDTFTKLGF